MYSRFLFVILIFLISLTFVSSSMIIGEEAERGFEGVLIEPPPITIIRNISVNGTVNFNTTQMEDNGGVLNILESWLSTLFDTFFGDKTTDDLAEGSTNLYDNQSWNETYADTLYSAGTGGNLSFNKTYTDELYVEVAGDTMTGDLNMVNANITLNNTYIIDANTSSRIYVEGETWVVVG